jgi:hypothetical protein
MSFAIQLTASDTVTPILAGLIGALEDPTDLHKAIAAEAEVLTRDYIVSIAPSRHKTAESLGATPTGYLERAAEGVSSTGERDAAVVILAGDVGGFARAFSDITITPKKGKFLTIPAKAATYGKRAGEFDDLELIVFKSDDTFAMALGKRTENDTVDVYFWLRRKVFQRQDRSLLPSDDQYLAAAEMGAIAYLDQITEGGQAAA